MIQHPTWNIFCDNLEKLSETMGSSIYDFETGKSWDIGQAVCREAYGPNWNTDPEFVLHNNQPDYMPVPDKALEIVARWLAGEKPRWANEDAFGD